MATREKEIQTDIDDAIAKYKETSARLVEAQKNKAHRDEEVVEIRTSIAKDQQDCSATIQASTMAMLALGLMRPPLMLGGGRVLVCGEDTDAWDWDDWQALRGRFVSLVNQDPLSALNPVLPIGEQIREVMRIHRAIPAAAQEERLREVLYISGESFSSTPYSPIQVFLRLKGLVAPLPDAPVVVLDGRLKDVIEFDDAKLKSA